MIMLADSFLVGNGQYHPLLLSGLDPHIVAGMADQFEGKSDEIGLFPNFHALELVDDFKCP